MSDRDVANPGPPEGTNHLLWLSPVLALFGIVSYFTIFVAWPVFRDTGWFNLLLVFAAALLGYRGMRKAIPQGGWRATAGIASFAFTLLVAGLLPFYLFEISTAVPDADLAIATNLGEPIPHLSLMADDGTPVDLAEAAQGSLILVFYRGFW